MFFLFLLNSNLGTKGKIIGKLVSMFEITWACGMSALLTIKSIHI